MFFAVFEGAATSVVADAARKTRRLTVIVFIMTVFASSKRQALAK
jgi:hypothetical protein